MSIPISKKTADREIYLLYQPPHQSHTMPSLMRFSGSATKKKSPRSIVITVYDDRFTVRFKSGLEIDIEA